MRAVQRVWMVTPDREVVSAAGEQLAIVSQDALVKALIDAAIIVDRIGGCVFLQVERAPTGVEGERMTVAASVVYKDRTDARPQPEEHGKLTVAPEPVPDLYDPAPGEVDVDESAVPAALREG